ncbi:hypothetical protein CHLNCDRAFT_135754 [Chlorella variabilis]|uniref:Phosphosulfolactate synthase n=1 Tax=Chlorella variabilis TaxID=554065 RepID=E1ZIX8_CHLVA|nr:hypothetical protein CHLNCDRAFT_135754 [Chlorella variabilis]EFN54411.1 hypothetical protein CHLNCDRAFT_135754 [Chlorella variabilis]|eukprot:XP_005846513.1 hypothetical protein CHLNCDRAFT_135754 [Chlorella variabilis]
MLRAAAATLLQRASLPSSAAFTAAALDLPCSFVPHNELPCKPRTSGLTEIRGPYYTPVTPTYLRELLDAVGHAVDGLKFAGGAFHVMNRRAVKALNDEAHKHDVYTSTGGWIEHVLATGRSRETVQQYLAECKVLGFDTVEVSTGFISLPDDDLVRLVKDVRAAGLRPKPEVGIQFGAGGDSSAAELAAEGTLDVSWAIRRARRCLEAGAEMVMIESEGAGITEDVASWCTNVVSRLVDAVGLEHLQFEAADPPVFSWYIKTFGAGVNLFVDHSQIVQLECLRRGIWGTKSTWGRLLTYGNGGGSGASSGGASTPQREA